MSNLDFPGYYGSSRSVTCGLTSFDENRGSSCTPVFLPVSSLIGAQH
jgi:hypothetical protein